MVGKETKQSNVSQRSSTPYSYRTEKFERIEHLRKSQEHMYKELDTHASNITPEMNMVSYARKIRKIIQKGKFVIHSHLIVIRKNRHMEIEPSIPLTPLEARYRHLTYRQGVWPKPDNDFTNLEIPLSRLLVITDN